MLGAWNTLENPTKHREAFWSKCHLSVDGTIPCSAFVFTSSLLQIESPPTDRLQGPQPHLCKVFGATTAVRTSHPPGRSLSSSTNKSYPEGLHGSAGHSFRVTLLLTPAEVVMEPFFLSCSCYLLQDSSASDQHEGWMSAHISRKCITIRGRHLRIIRKVQAALPVINVSKLRINLHLSYWEHYHFYIVLLKTWHYTREVSVLQFYSFLTIIPILL